MDLLELFKRQLASNSDSASKNTVKNYLSDVRHFINWYENTMKSVFEPKNVNSDIISLYEKSNGGNISNSRVDISTQLSKASVKRHLSSLRKFFSVIENQGLIAVNPFDRIAPETTVEATDYWHLRSFKDFLLNSKASNITVKNYVSDIAAFARWYEQAILPGLEKPLSSTQGFYLINQGVLEDYKKRLIQIQNAAPRTINRKLSSLRRYLDFATQKGFISESELTLDPVAVYEQSVIDKNEPKIVLSDITQNVTGEKKLSKLPPLRLLQRLIVFPYLGFEEKSADIIARIITGSPVSGVQRLPKKIETLISSKNNLRSQVQSVSSLLGVRGVQKEFFAPDKVSLLGQPFHKRLIYHARFTRPEWYKKYHDVAFVHYAHFALLIIFASGVGVALYNNLVVKNKEQASAAPTAPPRILSFQGRLTDNLDNPITVPTDIRFLIYNDATASGGALLWQEVQYQIAPDQDGIFSVLLGSNTTIPATVFSDNSSIYLGVAIRQTSELTPRQRIASVGYATNAEFLQGLPPTTQAGITSFSNVVLALDSSGNLTLSDSSPTNHTFQVTNGSFRIAGTTLQLITTSGSGGNVVIVPDGLGKIDIQKGLVNSTTMGNLSSGALEVNDKFAVLATESAVAAFMINNNTTGGDIFTASSSGTTRFTIANDGTITDSFYNTAGGIIYTSAGGVFAQTIAGVNGQCLQSTGGLTPTWGACGGTNYWNLTNGSIKPGNDTVDLLVGGQSTASAKFGFLNVLTGTPVASISANTANNATFLTGDGTLGTANRATLTLGNSSTYNSTGNILINPNGVGRLGIGTTNPLTTFDLRGNSGTQAAASISARTSFATLVVDNSGVGDLIVASQSGVSNFIVRNNGDIVVGQGGNGKITAAVVDPYLVQNQKTSGITSLTFQTMGASNADFIYQNVSTELSRLTMAGQFQLPITGSTGGIVLGGDTQLFRGAADRIDIATGDSFNIVSGSLLTGGATRIDSAGNGTFTNLNVTGTCTGCTSTGNSPFQVSNGAIVQGNTTLDFLIGGSSTSSAKFAVLNVNSGTPTASVSAATGAGYLTASGSLQTTAFQSLTLGGSTTGSLFLDSGNGTINLIDNTTITGNLTVSGAGTHTFAGTLDPTNVAAFTLTGAISGGNQNISSIGNISANSSSNTITGFGTIGSNGTTDFQGLSLSVSGDATISGGDITGANSAVLDIGEANSGDFTFNGDILLPEDGFIGLSASTARIAFDGSPTPNIVDVLDANLDLNGNGSSGIIINIGNTNTDFTTTGGLNLEGTLQLNTFTSNAGGVLYVNTSGQVQQVTAGTSTQCLKGGSTPSFSNCVTAESPFQVLQGAIVPLNSTVDFLVGGQASSSAKFAVLNVIGSGTPTASVSAGTSGALFVTAAGSVQTTARQTLTIGGGNTGNIILSPNSTTTIQNSTIFSSLTTGIAHISSTGLLSSSAVNLNSTDVTGILPVANGGSPWNQNNSTGTIFAGNTTLDILVGGTSTSSAKFAVTGIAGTTVPTASVSAQNASNQALVLAGDGSIQSVRNNTLTIGGSTTGFITLDSSSGQINLLDNTTLTGTLTGLTGLTLASGPITLGGSTGTGLCLLGGATASWGSCSGGIVSSPFEVRNGSIVQGNITLDLLVGGLATGSAKFAVLNLNTGTPVASVSSGLNGTAISFDSNGNIQTTKNMTLSIGGSTTGNILLNSDGSNFVGIGTVNPTEKLALAGGNLLQTASGNPILKGTYTTGSPYDVYVLGDYAYVVDTVAGLHIIDISDPANPSLITTYSTSNATGIYVQGKYAYLAHYGSGLDILDISNPAVPKLVGTFDTVGNAKRVIVVGKYAYVSEEGVGFEIVDISNPLSPTLTAYYDTDNAQEIAINGNYAYVADNPGIKIIDISNPASPTLVYNYSTGDGNGVQVSGKYAYIGDGGFGMRILNISNPASPVFVSTINISQTYTVAVAGNYAYLAGVGGGFHVVDITNRAAPSHVGTYTTSGSATRVQVSGKYAYIIDSSAGLRIIDINGILAPSVSTGSIATNNLRVIDNATISNLLTVGNGLNIGIGGLHSNSAFSFVSASGAGNLIQGAPTGKSLLTLNQTGNQDIFTASSAGTPRFTLTNSGGIRLGTNEGNAGQCLQSGGVGSGASWGSCGASGPASPFQTLSGAIVPLNSTFDTLLGGQATTSAALRITGQGNPFKGTISAASVSANTSFAGFVVDNKGVGDLFSASQSGVPNFVVRNNGDIVVGQGGNGKITAAVVDPYLVQNQKTSGITSLTFQTMGASNADFIYQNVSTELSRLTMAGQFQLPITGSTGGIVLGGDTQIFRGAANRIDISSGDSLNLVSGGVQVNGSTVIDSSGNGTFATLNITGSCTGCGGVSTTNSPFQLSNGAIVPGNTTVDFMLGSQATTSAKFAVLNLNTGTPTASVSSGLSGTGAYFDANGTFSTTNKGTFTLGGSTSGNILVDSGSGLITLSDNTTLTGNITVSGAGTHSFAGTIDPTNVAAFNLSGAISGGNQDITSIGNITANSSSNTLTGFGTLGTNGTTAFQGISLAISADATISGGDITGANGAILDIGEATSGDFTFNGDIILPEDGFIGLSSSTPRFVFDSTPTPDEIDVLSGNLDLNSNLILNIGDANTDFTSGGGLTLAGTIIANGVVTLGDGGDNFSIDSNALDISTGGAITGVTGLTLSSGSITLGGSTGSGLCLLGGTTASWGSCTGSGFASPFQTLQGAIVALNSSYDFLAGGQASTSAAFKVTGQGNPFAGTLSAASVSANTSFAGLVIDNKGVGDIFTASQSGMTQLVLTNNGSLGLGLGAGQRPTAKLDVNGNASISGVLSFRNGAGTIATTQNNTLTLGGSTTGNIIVNPTGTSRIGVGAINPLATFDIRGNQGVLGGGTLAVASVSGRTSFAALAVDNFGVGDIFTASSSSNTQFVIAQNGRVGIGNAARTPTAQLDVAGPASISGQLSFRTGIGAIQTTANNQLTIGGSTTGDVIIAPQNSSGILGINVASSNGIRINGTLATSLVGGNSCVSNIVNGLVTGTTACSGGGGTAGPFFTSNAQGTIFSGNATMDFLLGALGQATSSAQFAVLGLAAGTTPTASVSAVAGSNNGNGIVLSGDGSIQSLRKNNLVLGGSTTGDVSIRPNGVTALSVLSNGRIGIGTTNPTGFTHINGGNFGGNAALIVNQTGSLSNDIFSASSSGLTKFVISNDGRVGIGTNATPINGNLTAQLQILGSTAHQPAASISANSSGSTLLLTNEGGGNLITASVAGVTKFYVSANGDLAFSGDLIGLGGDFAEYFIKADKNEVFEAGQLVCIGTTGITKCSTNNPLARLIGVVSDDAFITGGGNHRNDPNYVLVGLVGQLGVRVEGEVAIGDPLTISSTPGVAKKATTQSNIIGFTKEALQPGKNRVKTVIQSNFYNPNTAINTEETFNNLVLSQSGDSYSILGYGQGALNNIDAFSRSLIANLQAGFIQAQRIVVNSFNATTAFINNLSGETLAFTQGSFEKLSLTTNQISIAGQSLNSYIEGVIDNYLAGQVISPTTDIANVRTDVISPLTDETAPSLEFGSSKLEVRNSNRTVAWFDSEGNASFSGTLAANSVNTNTLQVNSDASVSGTLTAGSIVAGNIKGLDDKLATLAAAISTQAQNSNNPLPVASPSSPTLTQYPQTLAVDSVVANFGIFEHGITSMGPITATDVTAMDTLGVGVNFTITDNAINTLGADLQIQSLRQANIAFQGGLIKMDTDGNMEIAGNLNVLGEVDAVYGVFSGSLTAKTLATGLISPLGNDDISVGFKDDKFTVNSSKTGTGSAVLAIDNKGNVQSSGSATFAKINFNLVGEAHASSLTEAVASGSAGFATLRSGQPEITIKNPNVTAKSLIYITPFGNTNNKVLYLLRQVPNSEDEDGSFTVGISGATTTQNIQFNWLIVN